MNFKQTRRDFLRTGGTALALAAVCPRLLAAAEKSTAPQAKRAIKKAIMWGTVGVRGSVAEKMKAIKAAGFDQKPPTDSYGAHAYATAMTAIAEAEAS